MFKHRLTKFGISSLFAMLMLFVGGSLQSCQDWLDVYPYDDPGDPEWLGASVYDFLKEGTANHKYTNIVAIIDSLGEKETLAHTGSKTLFVADDAAFERFFNNGENVWGVKSVGDMSKAQMKTILYGSMLDNAMLLDMLSSSGVGENNEGECLRRWSTTKEIDTIPVVNGNSMEHHKNWPTYNVYWDVLRGKDRSSNMRLAMDGSRTMMVHFLSDYLKRQKIQPSDIQFLFTKKGEVQKTYVDGDAFVYGNKVVSNDVDAGSYSDDPLTIICKNGYIYRLDELLLPPSNMADELRKRPDTRIFSHLLDRFCVPVYDDRLTKQFNAYYNTNDSIFRLRYLCKGYASNSLLDAANKTPESLLNFDPGQNDLGANGNAIYNNMAAMFVPNDEVLYQYYAHGAGHFLLDRFAPDVEVADEYSYEDVDALLSALDSVPEKNIVPFITNLLKESFTETVKSRFSTISDDAKDPMGITPEHVDECVVCNNGVIYILNNVFGPAKYEAVHAPTLVYENMEIMYNIIEQLTYDYYLLAMQANYSLIIPSDDYFVFCDPLSVVRDATGKVYISGDEVKPKVYELHYDDKLSLEQGQSTKKGLRFWQKVYEFDPDTYKKLDLITTKDKDYSIKDYTVGDKTEYFGGSVESHLPVRMADILENLIVVHNDEEGFNSGAKYFLTKGYATIKVDATDPNNIKIQGGEQLERGTSVVVKSQSAQKNGVAYCTEPGEIKDGYVNSAIPTPPTRSVYDNLKRRSAKGDLFSEFYNLCYPGYNIADTMKSFIDVKDKLIYDSAKRYSIFYTNTTKIKQYTKNTVPFFNVFHYTVYVPTNASIEEMYKKGLPSWEKINEVLAAGDPSKPNPKAAAMLRSMLNFAKYHFQDNSIFVDNSPIETYNVATGKYEPGKNFSTAVMNPKTNRFYELELMREGENILIKDDMDNIRRVVIDPNGEENKDWNIMCRDNVYESGKSTYTSDLVKYLSSSYSVLQPIDGVLLNRSMFGYDGYFKRFAANGCTVDTMYVDGTGVVNINGDIVGHNADVKSHESTTGGRNYYLVASIGRIKIADQNGVERVHNAGYLMKHIDEGADGYMNLVTHELLYYKSATKGYLITDEGYEVDIVEIKDKNGNVTVKYEYTTKEDANGVICRIKYANDPKMDGAITLVPYGSAASGDNANN